MTFGRIGISAVLVLGAALSAFAADGAGAGASADAATQQNKPGIVMEEVEIRGELEHPDVFYIIPRRKAELDLGSLSKDFSKKIMDPILPGPFEASYGEAAVGKR